MAAPLVRAVSTALRGVVLAHPARASAASLCSCESRKRRSEEQEEEEEEEGPEYIPRRKAKNPMMVIGYAWMIGLPTGIIGFLLAKREVDKNRLQQLKVRQRMSRSNEGEYERSRYRTSEETSTEDRGQTEDMWTP